MRITLVAAMGRNRVIGTESGLPWHLPRDLKQFRALTVGKPVVLGRKTLDHIGRPLPRRSNIVLTRQTDYASAGVRVAHTIDDALSIAREEAAALGADEVMVIGGGEVYRAFLPLAGRVYLTVVGGTFAGTATFPLDDLARHPFAATALHTHPADEKNAHALTLWQLDRVEPAAVPLTPLAVLLGAA